MKRKLLLVLCPLLLLSCFSYSRFSQTETYASSSSPVHNLNTGLNYTTIQEAINDNETLSGQTILVSDGTYYENVVVNKSLTLIGESMSNTIVDGNGTGPAFIVTAQSVTLMNFTATNAGVPREYTGFPDSPSPAEAILLNGTSYCLIECVETSRNNFGMYLNCSDFNTVQDCTCIGTQSLVGGTINASQSGIVLGQSNNNTLAGNVLSGNFRGIGIIGNGNLLVDNQAFSNIWHGFDIVGLNNTIASCQAWNNSNGILLDNANGTTIKENSIVNNTSNGIWLIDGASSNIICENTIQNNYIGISGSYSPNCGNDNIFYHNNIIGNAFQVYMPLSSNTWDAGYPSGGNYWSNYGGADLFNGPYQSVSGSDGIGDTPYALPSEDTWNGTDRYPLIGIFSDFNVTPQCGVQTICNSTISNFNFNGTAIDFDVSGQNGTTGFCRICIPTTPINGTFAVFVNGTEIPYTLLPESSSTNSYLYFTFQEIIVTPEFSSLLILPLFLTATLLAVIIYQKKGKVYPNPTQTQTTYS